MKAITLLSGGLDSLIATMWYKHNTGAEIYALHFDYGQRSAKKDRECAEKQASALHLKDLIFFNLQWLGALGTSSLTDPSVSRDRTYVPFRNANMLSVATSVAIALGAETILFGAHEDDHGGFPDCRPEFMGTFQKLIELGSPPHPCVVPRVENPLITTSKANVVSMGDRLGAPFGLTWSCYESSTKPCGVCLSCLVRREAFSLAGIVDPLEALIG